VSWATQSHSLCADRVCDSSNTEPLWTDCARLQQEQLEKALPSAAEKGKLQEQIKRSVAEGNTYSYQLAHLHEERDKALVEMSRLEEVAPLARKEHGVNKRLVCHRCSPLHPTTACEECCWNHSASVIRSDMLLALLF